MEFKRVKMLSGMLSAAAIASLTGIPVLADTAAVDGPSLTNTLENGQDEESTDESRTTKQLQKISFSLLMSQH